MVMRGPKEAKPLCPKCQWEDYTIRADRNGFPVFTCDKCNALWTKGLDGGEYAAWAHFPKS